jgi:hypothetical protein
MLHVDVSLGSLRRRNWRRTRSSPNQRADDRRALLESAVSGPYFVTKEKASWVASALIYFVEEQLENEHFRLVVYDVHGAEDELWVRPLLQQDFAEHADGSQVVTCVARDGRLVSIGLASFDSRRSLPAKVSLGESPLPDEGF